MENHKASSSKKASPDWCQPKKTYDQRTFRTSWIQKIAIIFPFCQSPLQNRLVHGFQVFPSLVNKAFFTCQPFFQTIKSEIPIRENITAQTGAKTHAGGVNVDLVKVEYQGVMAGIVKTDPTHPAICGMASETTSFHQSSFFIRLIIAHFLVCSYEQKLYLVQEKIPCGTFFLLI